MTQPVRYDICFDTEFWTFGNEVNIISIGCYNQFGGSYYAEVAEFDWSRVPAASWLQENVRPLLSGGQHLKPRDVICKELTEWTQGSPRFWAYYGAYDWTAMCMLFGGFPNLPDHWQKYYWEIQTYRNMVDEDLKLPPQPVGAHNAGIDAKWNYDALRKIQNRALTRLVGNW